jgi:hypothetical protein
MQAAQGRGFIRPCAVRSGQVILPVVTTRVVVITRESG